MKSWMEELIGRLFARSQGFRHLGPVARLHWAPITAHGFSGRSTVCRNIKDPGRFVSGPDNPS